MENNKIIGNMAEFAAQNFLKEKGYTIIDLNFRSKTGEIDIIAYDKSYIVFIEVKYRKNLKNGMPREAVNYKKQSKIIKTAQYYLMIKNIYNKDCRFDVIELYGDINNPKINLIQNAFIIQ